MINDRLLPVACTLNENKCILRCRKSWVGWYVDVIFVMAVDSTHVAHCAIDFITSSTTSMCVFIGKGTNRWRTYYVNTVTHQHQSNAFKFFHHFQCNHKMWCACIDWSSASPKYLMPTTSNCFIHHPQLFQTIERGFAFGSSKSLQTMHFGMHWFLVR